MEAPSSTLLEPAGPERSKEHWMVLAIALTGLVAFALVSLLLEPDPRGYGTHEKLGLQPCLPMVQWGIPCPGCGVTTSVTLASKGRLWDSFVNQPFGLLLAGGVIAFGIWAPIAHFLRRDLWQDVRSIQTGRWFFVLVGLISVAWVWKLIAVLAFDQA